MGGRICSVDTLGELIIHILGGMEQNNEVYSHAMQNGAQFNTYELFISRIFHLIFHLIF